MPTTVSQIFSVILAVLLLIFFPIYQIYEKQENLAYQTANNAVTKFVDNVRTKGYITPKMIEDFESELEVGDFLYDIEMKHERKVYNPVYTDPSNSSTFQNKYVVDYDEYYKSQIYDYLFSEKSNVPKGERMYKLSVGDYFSITVENKTKTKADLIFDALVNGNTGNKSSEVIQYGGMVLNEDY